MVATVTRAEDLTFLSGSGTVAADLLEYRLDDLFSHLDEVAQCISSKETRPSLVTVRTPDEGGANRLSLNDRIATYRQFFLSSDLVDTEITSLETPEFSDFISEAHSQSTLVLASYHNFQEWPGRSLLEGKIDRAYELGADIPKLAVVVESMTQLFDLVQLVEKYRSEGKLISAMGMGTLGKLSRLTLARAGSCLNYGYLQTENAPGQWSAAELRKLIDAI